MVVVSLVSLESGPMGRDFIGGSRARYGLCCYIMGSYAALMCRSISFSGFTVVGPYCWVKSCISSEMNERSLQIVTADPLFRHICNVFSTSQPGMSPTILSDISGYNFVTLCSGIRFIDFGFYCLAMLYSMKKLGCEASRSLTVWIIESQLSLSTRLGRIEEDAIHNLMFCTLLEMRSWDSLGFGKWYGSHIELNETLIFGNVMWLFAQKGPHHFSDRTSFSSLFSVTFVSERRALRRSSLSAENST
nr:hypothetical protein Iba_chr04bCG13930 [Ipomoea batatas]